jgi:hypothetical protein
MGVENSKKYTLFMPFTGVAMVARGMKKEI